MSREQINRISGRALMVLSLIALFTVVSGYFQPPEPDEGTAAHIFQLAILAFLAIGVLFLTSTDWRQPFRGVRPLAFPSVVLFLAFSSLYYLEHFWYR